MTDLATLIEAMCQGTATTADRDRLEALLRDPANRAQFVAASRLHSELLWRWHRGRISLVYPSGAGGSASPAGRGACPSVAPAKSPRRRIARRLAASVAAVREGTAACLRFFSRPAPFACLFAAIVLTSFLGAAGVLHVRAANESGFASSVRRGPPVVARVTGLHQVRWQSRHAAWQDWDALPVGARLELAAGLVQVTYHSGANVVIEGPAVYEASGPASGRLLRGRIAARTEHEKPLKPIDPASKDLPPLFTVQTPTRLVHDLGTEFGVEVEDKGKYNVHVFEGLVELASVAPSTDADEVPVRLGAGESAGIDEAGRINTSKAVLARRFVRSLPKADVEQKPFLEQLGWNVAAAEVIYRDRFTGEGQLTDSTPASRGGVGAADWVAPAGWSVGMAGGGLEATSPGSAVLPFLPEPGWLYRISIDFDVFAGGIDWFAVGLVPALQDHQALLDVAGAHAWMGQRHQTNAPGFEGNFAFAGPGGAGLVMPIDFATGRQQRSILLDTRGRAWIAYFLHGDQPVARASYPLPPTVLTHIALSQFGKARTRIHAFSLARLSVTATKAAPSLDKEPVP
jgi:hypothetical protein